MKKQSRAIFLLILILILPGCAKKRTWAGPICSVVVRVDVESKNNAERIYRRYTDPKKVSAMLDYIRKLSPYMPADRDPERLAGESHTITVYSSDGTMQVYRQRANAYLSVNSQPWQKIDNKEAQALYPYLLQNHSDF